VAGTIFFKQDCFQMSQVCELWSEDGYSGSERLRRHYFLFADKYGNWRFDRRCVPLNTRRLRHNASSASKVP